MKMSKWFHEKTTLCGDTIEDSEFSYAVMSCEYLIDGVDAGAAICHAINNHDRMVDEIAELKGALREARGALSACSIQESRNDGSENRMKIKALDKQVYEIDSLLAKLNQEGEE